MVVWALMLSADDKSVWPDPASLRRPAAHPLSRLPAGVELLPKGRKIGLQKPERCQCAREEEEEEEIRPHGRKEGSVTAT